MNMKYKPTTTSAIEFSNCDHLEEWVHLFLSNEGNNKALSDGLKLESRKYFGPIKMNLNLFERCCGPEEGIKYQIPITSFDSRVNAIMIQYKNGDWDMPPLIINRFENKYELNDGNHRFEALKRLDIHKFWVIIWETVNKNPQRELM